MLKDAARVELAQEPSPRLSAEGGCCQLSRETRRFSLNHTCRFPQPKRLKDFEGEFSLC